MEMIIKTINTDTIYVTKDVPFGSLPFGVFLIVTFFCESSLRDSLLDLFGVIL